MSLGTILSVIPILILLGAVPAWPYSWLGLRTIGNRWCDPGVRRGSLAVGRAL